jgi:hypothetical protein
MARIEPGSTSRLARYRTTGIIGRTVVPPGLGPETVQPSQPGSLGPEQGSRVSLPGANFPPAGATPVNEPGDANIAAGASATIVSIVVPDTQRFRITGIGFGADDETALAFLTWSVQFGPDPQPGFLNKPATLGTLQVPFPVFMVAGSSVTVNLVVTALAAAVVTYRYIGIIQGYNWREETI